MTTSIRRASILSLATLLGLAAACSDNSLATSPITGGPRATGYTVPADRSDTSGHTLSKAPTQAPNQTTTKKAAGG